MPKPDINPSIDFTDLEGHAPMSELIKNPRLIPVNFDGIMGWVCAPASDDRAEVERKLNSSDPNESCMPPVGQQSSWSIVVNDDPDPELCSPGGCGHETKEHPRRHWLFGHSLMLGLLGQLDPQPETPTRH